MNKRTINLILLILIIVFLLAGILYFVFLFKTPKNNPSPAVTENKTNILPASSTTTPIVKQVEIVKNPNIPAASNEEVTRFNLEKIASSFAERLGSYSNQSNFSNILDLKVFMTLSMQK
jgi:hypothetical protein